MQGAGAVLSALLLQVVVEGSVLHHCLDVLVKDLLVMAQLDLHIFLIFLEIIQNLFAFLHKEQSDGLVLDEALRFSYFLYSVSSIF